MRVIAEQTKPKKRKKGVKKKKGKNDKVDMRKIKSLFGQDVIVKLLLALVDKKNEVYLRGVTVDYVRQGLNEGFEFINPNERDRCGCGESFRV